MRSVRRRVEPRIGEVVDGVAMGVMGSRTAVRWAILLLAIGAGASTALIVLLQWHWLFSVVAAMCGLTFLVYGYDKAAARRGASRIPERVLHLLALLGGAPGALAGQRFFRHKTSKPRFQIVFWTTAIAEAGLIALFLWKRL